MSTPVRMPPFPSDRGSPDRAPPHGTVPLLAPSDPTAALARPSSLRRADPGGAETEGNRWNVAFEAIHALTGCLDQMLRELRRGVPTAQWRVVQEEVMRVRRLVTGRPETREGPPRDEGPASQPAPETDSAGQPPTPPAPVGPSTPHPGS